MLKNVAHIHIDWYNYSENARYASQKQQFLIQNHQYHLQSASLTPLALGKLKTKTNRTSMCMFKVDIVCVCLRAMRCDATTYTRMKTKEMRYRERSDEKSSWLLDFSTNQIHSLNHTCRRRRCWGNINQLYINSQRRKFHFQCNVRNSFGIYKIEFCLSECVFLPTVCNATSECAFHCCQLAQKSFRKNILNFLCVRIFCDFYLCVCILCAC